MDGVADLGAVRRERAYLASIARQHPDTRATSLDALPALLDQENEGSITMVRQIKKLCEGCGLIFEAKRSDQRFHSAACKAQHHRDLQAVEAVEEGPPIDLLAQALIRAFSLRVAGSVEAPAALGALLPLLLAEVEPSTPLTPEPIAAPVVASPMPEPIAAPAFNVDALRERLLRVLAGDNHPSQKAIAKAIGVDQGSFSHFISEKDPRPLKKSAHEPLSRWLDEYERTLKPR